MRQLEAKSTESLPTFHQASGPFFFFFSLNYYYLHVQMQKSVFKNKVEGQILTLSSVGTARMWCLRPCSGQNSTVERRAFLFCFGFFGGRNSYRAKDPLMSCLEALKQTIVFSDSSGTCISLHFFISFLLAFCHQRCLQEKRIIIINFKEVICSCFISLSPGIIIFCLSYQNCCCGSVYHLKNRRT